MSSTPPQTPVRDRSIDVIRAACLVVVVLLHAVMAGVSVRAGETVFANALDAPWFWPVSWVVQVMPLFFLAGGATGVTAWRRRRAGGETASSFVHGRLMRLLRPSIVAMAVVAVALAALSAAGAPEPVVAEAGFRISQPLWFLGVFLLVQALVPAMVALHERRPVVTLVALSAAVCGVDIARAATGAEAVGLLNLAFVWLLIQQLGFALADGWCERIRPRVRIAAALIALVGLGALAGAGVYSPDMYVNLNPPTAALLLLGVAQTLLFSVAQPALRRVGGATLRVVDVLGTRAMTIYLWHMPVIIGLAGLLAGSALLRGTDLPEILSVAWWASRPLWCLVIAALVFAVARIAHGAERPASGQRAAAGWRVAAGALLGIASVACVFVRGLDVETAVLSAAIGGAALFLSSRPAAGGFPPHLPAGQTHSVRLA
ncbi:acyltransferase family protein [Microbacterium sp. gxy059]|uniref:acyltransferase family protein n=1 Tax=Microbacterium sp. gxy059 TaxID=2957199 RepID=UPI003D9831E5